MAGFVIGGGNGEFNFFEQVAKLPGSVVFTETFASGELEKVRDTDKSAPLSYLKQGHTATIVVALPAEALADFGIASFDAINTVQHDKIVTAVNKYQKAKGGLLFEFRSLFNGSISLVNLVDQNKVPTTHIPDNGLHDFDCKQIKAGIENGTIVSTYYKSIYRLKDGDCKPIRCYALASHVDNL